MLLRELEVRYAASHSRVTRPSRPKHCTVMEHRQEGARLHREARAQDEIARADRQRTHRSCMQDTGIAKDETIGHELAARRLAGNSDTPEPAPKCPIRPELKSNRQPSRDTGPGAQGSRMSLRARGAPFEKASEKKAMAF